MRLELIKRYVLRTNNMPASKSVRAAQIDNNRIRVYQADSRLGSTFVIPLALRRSSENINTKKLIIKAVTRITWFDANSR